MKKEYTTEDIYKMSLGQLKAKYGAAGQTDAKLSQNEADSPVMSGDRLNRLMSLASGVSADSEKLYAYYKNKYTDGAALAAENAYGLASANTGGYGSTYASAVAGSAYEKYMQGLYDTLEKANANAFNNAVSFAEKAAGKGDYSYYEALGADMSAAKRADALEQAVTEARYGDYSGLDNMGVDTSVLRGEKLLEFAAEMAKYGDYSGLDYMGVDTSALRGEKLLELAAEMAKYGDYSGLDYIGVDTTAYRYNELLELAAEMAKYGDYSGLEALGVNTQRLKEEKALEKALALAKYGDFSLLGDFSDNLAALKSKIGVTVQKGAESAYANSGYSGLISYLDRQLSYGQINAEEKKRITAAVTGA